MGAQQHGFYDYVFNIPITIDGQVQYAGVSVELQNPNRFMWAYNYSSESEFDRLATKAEVKKINEMIFEERDRAKKFIQEIFRRYPV